MYIYGCTISFSCRLLSDIVQTVNSNTDEKIMNAELGMDFGMFDQTI